jgi:hypothetical protein
MSSAHAMAAKSNGAKSNGPITLEGKARSAKNSLKHGLTGGDVVIPGESQEEFDILHADFVAHYLPSGEMETDLVFEIASSRWRLRRLQQMESDFYATAIRMKQEAMGEDVTVEEARAQVFYELSMNPKPLNLFHRHSTRLRRSYEKALKELHQLQQERAAAEDAGNGVQNEAKLTQSMLHFLTAPPPLPSRSQTVYSADPADACADTGNVDDERWRPAA